MSLENTTLVPAEPRSRRLTRWCGLAVLLLCLAYAAITATIGVDHADRAIERINRDRATRTGQVQRELADMRAQQHADDCRLIAYIPFQPAQAAELHRLEAAESCPLTSPRPTGPMARPTAPSGATTPGNAASPPTARVAPGIASLVAPDVTPAPSGASVPPGRPSPSPTPTAAPLLRGLIPSIGPLP